MRARIQLRRSDHGHRSVVRRAVVDPAPAVENGWTTWQGLTPVLPVLASSTVGRFVVGPAGFVGMMPAGDGLVQWWFDAPSDAGLLRDRFAGYPHLVQELLDGIRDSDVDSFAHVVHRVPTRWGVGPVTLVGDAAHAFPPTQAQGANQALEDAAVLARELRGPGTISDRLRRYETERAPRVRRLSRLAASEATNKLPAFPLRCAQSILPPRWAGLRYLALIRRWSSVL